MGGIEGGGYGPRCTHTWPDGGGRNQPKPCGLGQSPAPEQPRDPPGEARYSYIPDYNALKPDSAHWEHQIWESGA